MTVAGGVRRTAAEDRGVAGLPDEGGGSGTKMTKPATAAVPTAFSVFLIAFTPCSLELKENHWLFPRRSL